MTEKKDISTPPTGRSTPRPTGERRGLVIVNTGDGKGKTTAALGLMVRAAGRGFRTQLFQFIKHEGAKFGEHRSFDKLEIPYQGLGDGFSWKSRDLERSKQIAAEGWKTARQAVVGGDYDLVVLDEITYPVNWGWFPLEDVIAALRERPANVHVVITGRNAPDAIVDLADTVTEMKKIKHAFEANVPAQKGIEH
ncbi:MAG: cob(I)yrinic acid a,c-diamide adenosyltransferase [Opitutales bacterium]